MEVLVLDPTGEAMTQTRMILWSQLYAVVTASSAVEVLTYLSARPVPLLIARSSDIQVSWVKEYSPGTKVLLCGRPARQTRYDGALQAGPDYGLRLRKTVKRLLRVD